MDRLDEPDAAGPAAVGMAFQIVVGPDGRGRRFTYVSSSCEALNGVSAQEALDDASKLYGLILPDHLPRVMAAEADAVANLAAFTIEAPFRRPDGAVRWHRLTSAPRRLQDGSTLWDGFQVDITQQRLAQRRLELALDATHLGLWEFDIGAERLFWSRRTRELYGVGPDDPVDFDVFRASIHPDDRDKVIGVYQQTLDAGGGDFTLEHRTVAPDGKVRWVLAHGRILADGGAPAIVIGTSLDITARKEAEEARALLLGELNHRVKNDFQIVAGLLEMQARRTEDPLVKAELDKAQRRVAGIARAHQNLYADDGRAAVDMDAYLAGICENLIAGLFGDGGSTLHWRADPYRLERERAVAVGLIVNELVTNAVKHAFAGARAGRVEVLFERMPDHLRLIVADDGPGLPDPSMMGKGLGRSLVLAFARQARGALRIENAGGARYTLRMDL